MLARMTRTPSDTQTATKAPKPPGKLLYNGPAGTVWADGLALYQLSARGITVQGVMAGGPSNQPTPAEMQAVTETAQHPFGPLKPWMVAVIFVLLLVALNGVGAPLWADGLLLLLALAVLVGWPVYRQLKAYESLFAAREELTILLSDIPTQMVSSMVEVGPDTPAEVIKPARQPVAVVVRGLSAAERAKLARSVTQHVAVGQALAARKK